MPKFQFYAPLLFTLFLILPGTPLTGHAQTTLLIPSQTSIEEKQVSVPAAGRNAKAQTAEKKDSQSQQKKAPEAAPAGNGNQAAKAGSVRDGAQQSPQRPDRTQRGRPPKRKTVSPSRRHLLKKPLPETEPDRLLNPRLNRPRRLQLRGRLPRRQPPFPKKPIPPCPTP